MKQINPLKFFSLLKWLDGRPLTILPYRQKIFTDVLYTFDETGSLFYNQALLLRGKKNDKSLDSILAQLFGLCTWEPIGGFTGLVVAFDEGQADQDLDLAKKLIRANPILEEIVLIRQKSIERKDGRGIIEIRPGRDVQGQHGGKFDMLVIDEIHTQRNWDLLESLQPDPTRQALTWITSYNSVFHKPLVPLFDMLKTAWAGTDPTLYFSYYAGDRTTDPDFQDKTPEERANPSMISWTNKNYLRQQQRRLPSHKYRRLHLNLTGTLAGSALSAERVDDAIARGVKVRPPVDGIDYVAFTDASGGSDDDMTLAIAHRDESGRGVLDCIANQNQAPPFDPLAAVKRFASIMKEYGVTKVVGDRYAGKVFPSAFQKEGISYQVSELTKHEIYEAIEVQLNTGSVVLLDHEVTESQFLGLIWRGTKIDHLLNEHDDFCNSVAGAIGIVLSERRNWKLEILNTDPAMPEEIEEMEKEKYKDAQDWINDSIARDGIFWPN